MPEAKMQADTAVALPIGPLKLIVGADPVGVIAVANNDATPPALVVTITMVTDGEATVLTSTSASLSASNALEATFPSGGAYQSLTGTVTSQTAASGSLTPAGSSDQIAWSASQPVLHLPITKMPFFVATTGAPVAAGTVSIENRENEQIWMVFKPQNGPKVTLGNVTSQLNAVTGDLQQFTFTQSVEIGGVAYTGMQGTFLGNHFGSGTLDGPTNATWTLDPTMTFPTPVLNLVVNGAPAGQIQILQGRLLQFRLNGQSTWGPPEPIANKLHYKTGKLLATTLSVTIEGTFSSNSYGQGVIVTGGGIDGKEDSWVAEGTEDPT